MAVSDSTIFASAFFNDNGEVLTVYDAFADGWGAYAEIALEGADE